MEQEITAKDAIIKAAEWVNDYWDKGTGELLAEVNPYDALDEAMELILYICEYLAPEADRKRWDKYVS